MSYPPAEGYPTPGTQPTVGIPAQSPAPASPAFPPAAPAPAPTSPAVFSPASPAAPSYSPAAAQISGTPYGPPEGRRRSSAQLLAVAAAVLLVFGGLMLGLYLNERGNLNDTKSTLRDTRADLSAQVQEQKTLNAQQAEKLAASEKRAADLDTQLATTKANLTKVTGERDTLVPCMRRIQDAFDAAADGSASGVSNALRAARTACDKAEIKVDS
ncbi:hypothetical protein [Actinoplanes sp. TBRC 11911]|uniref:hypothetical protein n=1 Tax=Actinoplanes sp. TBRC 11911 TaxID=2729386 RepID=UPI001B7D7409|nr:hypothetical protein [Actinoplanes sp. TBRC 11911]